MILDLKIKILKKFLLPSAKLSGMQLKKNNGGSDYLWKTFEISFKRP
jgi:hypothetical protein